MSSNSEQSCLPAINLLSERNLPLPPLNPALRDRAWIRDWLLQHPLERLEILLDENPDDPKIPKVSFLGMKSKSSLFETLAEIDFPEPVRIPLRKFAQNLLDWPAVLSKLRFHQRNTRSWEQWEHGNTPLPEFSPSHLPPYRPDSLRRLSVRWNLKDDLLFLAWSQTERILCDRICWVEKEIEGLLIQGTLEHHSDLDHNDLRYRPKIFLPEELESKILRHATEICELPHGHPRRSTLLECSQKWCFPTGKPPGARIRPGLRPYTSHKSQNLVPILCRVELRSGPGASPLEREILEILHRHPELSGISVENLQESKTDLFPPLVVWAFPRNRAEKFDRYGNQIKKTKKINKFGNLDFGLAAIAVPGYRFQSMTRPMTALPPRDGVRCLSSPRSEQNPPYALREENPPEIRKNPETGSDLFLETPSRPDDPDAQHEARLDPNRIEIWWDRTLLGPQGVPVEEQIEINRIHDEWREFLVRTAIRSAKSKNYSEVHVRSLLQIPESANPVLPLAWHPKPSLKRAHLLWNRFAPKLRSLSRSLEILQDPAGVTVLQWLPQKSQKSQKSQNPELELRSGSKILPPFGTRAHAEFLLDSVVFPDWPLRHQDLQAILNRKETREFREKLLPELEEALQSLLVRVFQIPVQKKFHPGDDLLAIVREIPDVDPESALRLLHRIPDLLPVARNSPGLFTAFLSSGADLVTSPDREPRSGDELSTVQVIALRKALQAKLKDLRVSAKTKGKTQRDRVDEIGIQDVVFGEENRNLGSRATRRKILSSLPVLQVDNLWLKLWAGATPKIEEYIRRNQSDNYPFGRRIQSKYLGIRLEAYPRTSLSTGLLDPGSQIQKHLLAMPPERIPRDDLEWHWFLESFPIRLNQITLPIGQERGPQEPKEQQQYSSRRYGPPRERTVNPELWSHFIGGVRRSLQQQNTPELGAGSLPETLQKQHQDEATEAEYRNSELKDLLERAGTTFRKLVHQSRLLNLPFAQIGIWPKRFDADTGAQELRQAFLGLEDRKSKKQEEKSKSRKSILHQIHKGDKEESHPQITPEAYLRQWKKFLEACWKGQRSAQNIGIKRQKALVRNWNVHSAMWNRCRDEGLSVFLELGKIPEPQEIFWPKVFDSEFLEFQESGETYRLREYNTPEELTGLGTLMSHCIGGYSRNCLQPYGPTHIFNLYVCSRKKPRTPHPLIPKGEYPLVTYEFQVPLRGKDLKKESAYHCSTGGHTNYRWPAHSVPIQLKTKIRRLLRERYLGFTPKETARRIEIRKKMSENYNLLTSDPEGSYAQWNPLTWWVAHREWQVLRQVFGKENFPEIPPDWSPKGCVLPQGEVDPQLGLPADQDPENPGNPRIRGFHIPEQEEDEDLDEDLDEGIDENGIDPEDWD